MATKKIKASVKLQVKAGLANPSPPIGPALGQHGVNIMKFCQSFNDQTKEMDKTLPVPVIITVYADRSFTFIIKTPPASALILKELNLQKGSSLPHSNKVGQVNREQLEKIARIKMPDLTASNLDAAVRTIAGTARSMGIDVEEE